MREAGGWGLGVGGGRLEVFYFLTKIQRKMGGF